MQEGFVGESRTTYDGFDSQDSSADADSQSKPKQQRRATGPNKMSLEDTIREIKEIRSHYTTDIREDLLSIGYELDGKNRHYDVEWSKVPMGGLKKWMLYGGPRRGRLASVFTIDTIRGAEAMAQRQLTQNEVEGFVFHAAKKRYYNALGNYTALATATWMTWYGYSTFKFPFRKAQPIEKYNNFPNRWMPILKGSLARFSWQSTRFTTYTVLCVALISPLARSMGDTTMMVGLNKDSRTHDALHSMKDEITKKQGLEEFPRNANVGKDRSKSRQQSPRPPPKPEQADGSPQNTDSPSDMFSTSSTSDANTYDSYSDRSYADTSTHTGEQAVEQRQSRQQDQQPPTSRWSQYTQPQKPKPDSLDDFYDDASPVAQSSRPAPPIGSPASSGSSWERIRHGYDSDSSGSENKIGIIPSSARQAMGQNRPRQGPRQRQRQEESNAESFSFSKKDEDRALAKERAQEDFDRMVEQERKGKGDGSSTGAGGGGAAGSFWGKRRGS